MRQHRHPSPAQIARALRDEESGVSLVEALVAVIILATAMLALAASAATSTVSLRVSRDRQQATQHASAVLEQARQLEYDELAVSGSPPSTYTFTDVDGTTVTEPVIADTASSLPHVQSTGRYTTTTYVTWADDPTQTLKRVTVISSWSDRGRVREIRESTLVALADRGLPVPNFLITPDALTEKRVSGEPVCFSHNLVNLGEKDSYSFQAGYIDGTGAFVAGEYQAAYTTATQGTRQGFKVKESSGTGPPWFAWAKLGPTDASGAVPAMTDVTGDLRPDSQAPVERRATVPVEFCLEPHSSGTGQSASPFFTFRVLSAFDPRVTREVTDAISNVETRTRLYLAKGSGNSRTKFELSQTKPLRQDVTADYDGPADGVPGLRFAAGEQSDAANWDYKPGRARISGNADLTIFLASDESVLGSPDGDLDESVTLHVRLAKLTSQGNKIVSVLYEQDLPPVLESELTSGWTKKVFVLPLPTTEFAVDEYLRLTVWDADDDDDDGDSHVHFDVNVNGTTDDPPGYGGTSSGTNEALMSNLLVRVAPL